MPSGSGGAAAQSFAVPNPYASGLGDTDISIRRLVVFGDSYSKLKRKSWRNWSEQLRYELSNPATGKTLVTALPAYAVSGATAGSYAGSTNDLTQQVTRWLGTAPKFVARDLTLVYLGYNDIKLSPDPGDGKLAGAMLVYQAQLDRIIKAGAAGSPRRIFLVMPHDWGRSPRYVGSPQSDEHGQRTQVWNALRGRARAQVVLHPPRGARPVHRHGVRVPAALRFRLHQRDPDRGPRAPTRPSTCST